MPRAKKYTQEVFDAINNPERRPYFLSVTPAFDIFDTLVKCRIEKRITQQELAEKAGISQPTLAKIEAGRANPTLYQLLKICEALNCTISIQPDKNSHDII